MFDAWKLQDYEPGQGVTAGAHTVAFEDGAWIDVSAPGDVHRALIAAGRIEDPFYDRNESLCGWMEDREWWYRLRFEAPSVPAAPDERLRLVFHGLDTFVTIWLNGEELGRHDNMFRPAVFDVTDRLRRGEQNTLALLFDRPLANLDEMPIAHWWEGNSPRVAMRKAQFGYGWDWGPRLPTIGIWRPVELVSQRRAAISGVHLAMLDIDQQRRQALVAVRVEIDQFADRGPLDAVVRLTSPDGVVVAEARTPVGGPDMPADVTLYLTVERPRLWWTHDLGEPALYMASVSLVEDDTVLDAQEHRFGLRTLVLVQSPDTSEPGTRFFRFVLNGVPVFAKGANWIPADSFVGAIPLDRYTELLTAARDANMTMLRVWGGGIYEHDHFYAECDRLGLLVWQDFMFACAPYPENNAAFVAEVEAEARYQVRRLRNHPSLALWCGNNENQWLHDQFRWDHPDERVPGALYYDVILPRAVAEEDGYTPYWPGSPYGGNDHNSMDDGDRHNWDVWHGMVPRRFGEQPRVDQSPEGVSYRRYAEDFGRFISEFGMHAAPIRQTLERVIPPEQLYHHSESMDWHNKDNPKNKGDNLMLASTGLPGNLDEYIDFSMIAQAEGLKFGIEHYRRRTPHCSGTLVWQLNDCWPVLSWSVLDYYGFGKAGYYYLKRVYAPVLASFKELPDGAVELWVTNDTTAPVEDMVTVQLGTFDGTTLMEDTVSLHVDATTSRAVKSWPADEVPGGADRYLSVRSSSGLFPANRYFFVPIKDLQRTRPHVEVAIVPGDEHQLEVRLRASEYAYFVHLSVSIEGTVLDDNYFDLLPGEQRTISVSNATSVITPERIGVHWR